jgi:hypothetical protein
MELRGAPEGIRAPAERRGDRAGDRPGEAAAPALALEPAGDPGRALLRFQLALALENQAFQRGLLGGREALDLRDLRGDAMTPDRRELDEILAFARERAELAASLFLCCLFLLQLDAGSASIEATRDSAALRDRTVRSFAAMSSRRSSQRSTNSLNERTEISELT